MAQHIGLSEIDETGTRVRDAEVNFALVNKFLTSLPGWQENYPWLSTIDEYGDTTFNHLQVPHIKSELDQLKSMAEESEAIAAIDVTINFISSIEQHKYVKFYGD
jgi:hypothetical protein